MINLQAERALIGPKIVAPRYQDYCFTNLHQAIINLLTNDKGDQKLPQSVFPKGDFSHVFLILVDSLGYLSFKKFQKYFTLPEGTIISPITSIFPSTTAAALASFSTGLFPQEHGLFEWRLYLPEVGDIIKTLPFCLDGSRQQDQLETLGFNPEKIFFKKPTIYQKLLKKRVTCFSFNHQDYYKSAFARIAQNGAKLIPFTNLSELLTTLNKTIIRATEKHSKTFSYVYLDSLDFIGHKYGPQSPYFETELAQIALMISKFLIKNLKESLQSKSLLLITADHGQIQVNPQKTIYLNRFYKLKKVLAQNANGKPILATGGPRDIFLHLKKGEKNNTIKYLKEKLNARADVYDTSQVLKKGWFGNSAVSSKKFQDRLGDVLVLPKKEGTVWLDDGEKKIDKLGHHGGLSAEEMIIPLISIPLP